MDWSDRLIWFAVGAILGYVIRLLQDIRREVHDVDKKVEHLKDDAGFVRIPIVLDALLILMVAATLYSIVRVEQSVDKSEEAVAALEAEQVSDKIVSDCNREALDRIVKVLDLRTTSTKNQLNANRQVVRAEAEVFRAVLADPGNDKREMLLLTRYLAQVDRFEVANREAIEAVEQQDWPSYEQLGECYTKEIPND